MFSCGNPHASVGDFDKVSSSRGVKIIFGGPSLTAHDRSRKLQNVSQQTTELLANNHIWFKNIDSRLVHLQQRLGADATMMRGGRSVQDNFVARDAQFPGAYRKTYLDLGLFGQVASSRSITAGKRSNGPYHYHSTFTFTPPPWLSTLVLHWDLQIHSVFDRAPRLSLSLSPIRYNPSQDLKAAITTFDISGLQRLFREGLAQPTDYIVQRRPVSLLEVCLLVNFESGLSHFSSRHSLHE